MEITSIYCWFRMFLGVGFLEMWGFRKLLHEMGDFLKWGVLGNYFMKSGILGNYFLKWGDLGCFVKSGDFRSGIHEIGDFRSGLLEMGGFVMLHEVV